MRRHLQLLLCTFCKTLWRPCCKFNGCPINHPLRFVQCQRHEDSPSASKPRCILNQPKNGQISGPGCRLIEKPVLNHCSQNILMHAIRLDPLGGTGKDHPDSEPTFSKGARKGSSNKKACSKCCMTCWPCVYASKLIQHIFKALVGSILVVVVIIIIIILSKIIFCFKTLSPSFILELASGHLEAIRSKLLNQSVIFSVEPAMASFHQTLKILHPNDVW